MAYVPYAEAFAVALEEKAAEAAQDKLKSLFNSTKEKMGRKWQSGYMPQAKRSTYKKKTYRSTPARKHFKKKQAEKVGHDVGTSTAKKCKASMAAINDQSYTIDTRILYGSDVTAVNAGTQINERLRGMINVRGLSVAFDIRNNLASNVVFNWAVIGLRNNLVSPSTGTSPYTLPTLATDGFFREYTGSRDVNFATTAWTAYNLNGLRMNSLPISTDQYAVFCHKRILLRAKDTTNTYSKSGDMAKSIRHYCKIDRQIRYNDDVSTNPETPIYLVYWCCTEHANSAETSTASAVAVQQQHVLYFREPNE